MESDIDGGIDVEADGAGGGAGIGADIHCQPAPAAEALMGVGSRVELMLMLLGADVPASEEAGVPLPPAALACIAYHCPMAVSMFCHSATVDAQVPPALVPVFGTEAEARLEAPRKAEDCERPRRAVAGRLPSVETPDADAEAAEAEAVRLATDLVEGGEAESAPLPMLPLGEQLSAALGGAADAWYGLPRLLAPSELESAAVLADEVVEEEAGIAWLYPLALVPALLPEGATTMELRRRRWRCAPPAKSCLPSSASCPSSSRLIVPAAIASSSSVVADLW